MIEIRGLSFSYGRTRILDNICLSAEAGECVGILGNNGAGKSTLVTCVNRIREPDGGDVFIEGVRVKDMSRREMARQIAYVAQKNEMTHTTVYDCVLLGRRPYIRWMLSEEDTALCADMMRKVGIEHLRFRYLDELSGGELQKVMLARALVQQPKVLLLDEPTSNLDPVNQYEMMHLVRTVAKEQGITVLVVMHDLNLALRYCDKFYFMKSGRMCRTGGTEIVTKEVIEEVYGMKAKVIPDGDIRVIIPFPDGVSTERSRET